MKKTIIASLILITLVGCSAWKRFKPVYVRIPGSEVYVKVPRDSTPRLWGNVIEFDHKGWQEVCLAESGKARCLPLSKASPR